MTILYRMNSKLYLFLFVLLVSFKLANAQSGLSSDELFQQARKAAFDQKDYTKAIGLSKQALIKSPDYSDIRVFLGWVYTWSDKTDSARAQFTQVLSKHPDNEEASFAFGSLEYWKNKTPKTKQQKNNNKKKQTQTKDQKKKKAKVLN